MTSPRTTLLVALCVATACGGGMLTGAPHDASTEDTGPAMDGGTDDSDDVMSFGDVPSAGDEPWDAAGWFDQFADARFFDGDYPPLPGMYPPAGDADCTSGGSCGPTGDCDIGSGWCCSGTFKHKDCACGESWGCVPPQECCIYPDAMVPVCAPSADACPHKYPP